MGALLNTGHLLALRRLGFGLGLPQYKPWNSRPGNFAGHAALGLQLEEDRQRFSSALLSISHVSEKGVRGFETLCKANALLHWHSQKKGFEFGDFHSHHFTPTSVYLQYQIGNSSNG